MAKNVSVDAKSAQEKEEDEEEVEEVEKEYLEKKNEMSFCLEQDPTYQISAVGKWYENSHGQVIGDVETYFLHILTNQRCETVRDCFAGWSEPDERSTEKWETLCGRVEELGNIEEWICNEKRVEV